jgi:hypothetical protein
LILEKNIAKHIQVEISRPTKWKLKFLGLNIDNRFAPDAGKYVQVSKQKAI